MNDHGGTGIVARMTSSAAAVPTWVPSPSSAGDEAPGSLRREGARRTLDSLIDGVLVFEKLIAWASAGRSEMVDAAVQWSALTLSEKHSQSPSATVPESQSGSGSGSESESESRISRWSPEVTALREIVSELATALRLPERSAESLIGESRALMHELPATRAALREGRIAYRHAQVMVEHAMSVPERSRAEFENAALPAAEELTVARFDRKARRMRERAHPETIRERHRAAVSDRCVEHSPERDGMAWIGARLPAPDVVAVWTRVTEVATGLQTAGEERTLTQLRADVFRDLLVDGFTLDADADIDSETGTGTGTGTGTKRDAGPCTVSTRRIRRGIGAGVRARVLVTVPVLTLLGRSDEPGELEGYGPIDASTARRLAAGASSFTRLLTHPETGVILSVGRTRYAVPKDLRTWLRLRDGTCRFPGCGQAAASSDIDHTVDWARNGSTAHDNLAHLCRRHHTLKHRTAWRVRHTGNGELQWTSPTGRSHLTRPEVVLPVPQPRLPVGASPPGAPSPSGSPPSALIDDPPPF